MSSLLLRFLHVVGFLVNPHPDGALGNFHGGIFDLARLRYIDQVPHERTEVQELCSDTVLLKNGTEVPCDLLICATGYKNEKIVVSTPDGTVLPHTLDYSSSFRGMIHPHAPRVAFMNPLTLGNIASDSCVVGRWLVKCLFPLLQGNDDEFVKDLLARSAAKQKEEMQVARCRPFNLWDAFDRPIQFMYHNLHRYRGEIEQPALVHKHEDLYWTRAQGSLFARMFYPLSAAAFLLRSTGAEN